MLLPIENKGLGCFGMAVFNKDLFNQILDILNGRNTAIFIDDLEDTDDLATDTGRLLHIGTADRLD